MEALGPHRFQLIGQMTFYMSRLTFGEAIVERFKYRFGSDFRVCVIFDAQLLPDRGDEPVLLQVRTPNF